MDKRIHFFQRSLLTVTVVIFSIVCSGCSFVVRFFIENSSERIVTVRYSTKNLQGGFDPKIFKENSNNGIDEIPIPEDRVIIDTQNRTVEFKMLPHEQVRIWKMHGKLDENYESEWNISSLSISSGEGSVSFEGSEVYKNFRPIAKTWYTFGPNATSFKLEYR